MTGEKVVLAPLAREDAPTLWRWINARDLVVHSAPYRPIHASGHEAWFADVQKRNDLVIFGIRTASTGTLVGTCQLHSIHPVHRSAELQIRIGDPEARGKGYGSQALEQLLRFGFGDLNLRRIWLHVLAGNSAALKLYAKFGFREEGRQREAVYIDGRYEDVVLMGLLRSESQTEARAA